MELRVANLTSYLRGRAFIRWVKSFSKPYLLFLVKLFKNFMKAVKAPNTIHRWINLSIRLLPGYLVSLYLRNNLLGFYINSLSYLMLNVFWSMLSTSNINDLRDPLLYDGLASISFSFICALLMSPTICKDSSQLTLEVSIQS